MIGQWWAERPAHVLKTYSSLNGVNEFFLGVDSQNTIVEQQRRSVIAICTTACWHTHITGEPTTVIARILLTYVSRSKIHFHIFHGINASDSQPTTLKNSRFHIRKKFCYLFWIQTWTPSNPNRVAQLRNKNILHYIKPTFAISYWQAIEFFFLDKRTIL